MPKEQTRVERAYQKALEIHDARDELNLARERVKDLVAALELLEDEHENLVDGKTVKVETEPTTIDSAMRQATKPRKARQPKTMSDVLDLTKADVLEFLRRSPGSMFSASDIAKALSCSSEPISAAVKALGSELVIEGKGRGKRYGVAAEVDDSGEAE
jgi:hypothetical protein